jgi:cytochrome c oxidase assembly protein subunit 15
VKVSVDGGLIREHAERNRAESRPWRTGGAIHNFALLTAAATLVLIFAGGLVTSTGSALAVPDWPLSFGGLFPRMTGGVLYEHGHRMIAGGVTILTLVLTIWMVRREPRFGVRVAAVSALCLILLQAVLGGLTVLFKLPLPVAVAHAACAQAFFCLVVALCIVTSPQWTLGEVRAADQAQLPLKILAAFTTIVIYMQILAGALMRHMGAGLAIPDFPLSYGRLVPPRFSAPVAVNFTHRVGALLVIALVIWTVARVARFHRNQPQLYRPALALAALLALQVTLGALTVWSSRAVIPTTLHVAIGAALLATSLTLTIRAYHLTRPLATGIAAPRRAHIQAAQGRVSA